MAATSPCRFAAYELLAAQLDGHDYPAEVCDELAQYTAVVQRDGDGINVRVDVEVCVTHDLILSTAPGWRTSIRKRHRPTAT